MIYKTISRKLIPSVWSFCLVLLLCNFIALSIIQHAGAETSSEKIFTGTSSSPYRIILPEWRFKPGANNAITDVAGVKVGHISVSKDEPHILRTGITAILPHSGNLATIGVLGSSVILNGNGEMTGLGPLHTSGILNSPILLTNTFSIGVVHQGVFRYFEKHYPDQWMGQLPLVAECYDGFFSTISDLDAIHPEDAVKAIESAGSGPVKQGRVGAGSGMRSFELHAGIGSSSRQIILDNKAYMIGVLVNTNHSKLDKLSPAIRQKLEEQFGSLEKMRAKDNQDSIFKTKLQEATPNAGQNTPRQGSIIVVIATDLPLNPTELTQLANRAALGIGKMGSTMDTTSGDFVIAFSTANPVTITPASTVLSQTVIHPDMLTSAYQATVEAVTEAQLHALVASHALTTSH